MNNNAIEGVSIQLVGDTLTNWNATIVGPVKHYLLTLCQSDTPFEGGKFIVNIDFSDNYPFKAPKVSSFSLHVPRSCSKLKFTIPT